MNFKIKEARQLAGITQKELAKTIGVSAGTLSDYENGNHDPKSDCLVRIADACGVTVDYLLGREKEKSPTPSEDSAGEKSVVDRAKAEVFLTSMGLIEPGQDLADEDLIFLDNAISLLEAWFKQRRQGI